MRPLFSIKKPTSRIGIIMKKIVTLAVLTCATQIFAAADAPQKNSPIISQPALAEALKNAGSLGMLVFGIPYIASEDKANSLVSLIPLAASFALVAAGHTLETHAFIEPIKRS